MPKKGNKPLEDMAKKFSFEDLVKMKDISRREIIKEEETQKASYKRENYQRSMINKYNRVRSIKEKLVVA